MTKERGVIFSTLSHQRPTEKTKPVKVGSHNLQNFDEHCDQKMTHIPDHPYS